MIVKLKTFVAFLLLVPCLLLACGKKQMPGEPEHSGKIERPQNIAGPIRPAAERMEAYLPILKNKKIALVVNQTSRVGEAHLVDSLLRLGISIEKIFAPEHGFRGHADAGEKVKAGLDKKTGLPIVSLYGKNKKPLPENLAGLDMMVFDVQDVGARFYTYISAMTYIMEACAENNLPLLILDRPNPNGHYVDGPVMEAGYESYIGMHAGVPVVHGMTVGEYAQMVNGEGWLKNNIKCDLKIIKCGNYNHSIYYELPVKPSPNLPNMRSIYLYPSLCFFEGTNVSVGRGTGKQFQIIGMPGFPNGKYTFTPVPKPGAKYPKHENILCTGFDFSETPLNILRNKNKLEIKYLLDFYKNCPDQNDFFLKNNFFDKLAGGKTFRQQIMAGKTEDEIRESWKPGLEVFKKMRAKYLLYP